MRPHWRSHLRRTVPPVLAAAVVGGLGTKPTSAWYVGLAKPAWQPPAWLFGPVWTGLYALTAAGTARAMAAAPSQDDAQALERQLWVNMALNAAWSWLFFTARSPRSALVEVVVLEASTVLLADKVRRLDPAASRALVPYVAWNAFAAALNAAIARRN
jgi:tryptophan-rich sensory protein